VAASWAARADGVRAREGGDGSKVPGHHHHHHGGGRRRGGRSGFGGPIYVNGGTDEFLIFDGRDLPLPLELDAVDAADLLPTFVTPTDAQNYLQEVDTGFARLDASILQSQVADNFKAAWAAELAAWRIFATGARASVGWLNSKAIMDQTDKWAVDLKNWDANFQAQGGKDVGPPPMPPGQGTPTGTGVAIADVSKLIVAGGVLAAIVVFGPKIAQLMKG
jgi:hypothetical protein